MSTETYTSMDQHSDPGRQHHDAPAGEAPTADRRPGALVRLIKEIALNPEKGTFIDETIIKYKYYNAFNYSLLSRGNEAVNLTLGVTSPKRGEGKTLVACNLAVSLAMSSHKKTVLVDLNVFNPRLHSIFGVTLVPGLSEGLKNGTIHVSETLVENLCVLSAGIFPKIHDAAASSPLLLEFSSRALKQSVFGLDQLPALRDVIYSLEQEFDFVIVDMPSINSEEVPILVTTQLHGLLIVVNSGKTKREDLDLMFRHINETQVLGFVFNRFKSEEVY